MHGPMNVEFVVVYVDNVWYLMDPVNRIFSDLLAAVRPWTVHQTQHLPV